MDEFDSMSEFSPFTWQPVYSDGSGGELMDFNAIEHQSHLSTSRGILETIVEETSDDEESGLYGAKWSGSDSFSSGSSDTGSVVRVDLVADQDSQDTISERDFICPPKRRKQEAAEQPKLDFIPTSSLFSQLLNPAANTENGIFDSYFMKQSDLRYRFDELGVELFTDSDRLSYTSLSRSSSLIQFESLERQLQGDSQTLSGSSPSIYSYEGPTSSVVHHSQEISEKSAPIAITLPTIKITNPPPLTTTTIQFTNSDSEPFSSSSTSGSYSSDDSEIHKKVERVEIATETEQPVAVIATSAEGRKKFLNGFRAKNSVDSLSEDSGYCDRERAGALSLDSSLPTGNDLEDEEGNVIEEKSILRDVNAMRHFVLAPRVRSHSDDDDMCYHSMENLNRRFKARKIDLLSEIGVDSSCSSTTMPRAPKIASPNVHIPNERSADAKNRREENAIELQSEKLISISLPELSASGDKTSRRSARSKLKRNYRQSCDELDDHFASVSSVPDHINQADLADFSWTEPCESVASKNFNLYDFNYSAPTTQKQKAVDISASCANLTLLNYSDENDFDFESRRFSSINRSKSQTMSGRVPATMMMASDSDDDDAYIAEYRSKELSSLLEEISAHFDKNLSILNDREASCEPPVTSSSVKVMKTPPPKPPPRRSQIKTSPNLSVPKSATFDRDPTNLTTSYAQSLEKCNFNVDEPINVYSSRQNLNLKADEDLPHSTPIKKRNFVSSTPNLNFFDFAMRYVNHYSSTDNTAMGHEQLSPSFTDDEDIRCTSMKEIPTNSRASSQGILASHSTAGSKSGLSVSFCPIVSEISWQEEPIEDEDFSSDVDMDPASGFSGTRNDSLVNYYNSNEDDDDGEEEDFDDFIAVGTSPTPCVGDRIQQQNIESSTIIESEKHRSESEERKESQTAVEQAAHDVDFSQKMLVETQTPSEKFIAAESSADVKVNHHSQVMTTVPQKIASEPMLATTKSGKHKKSIFSRLSSGLRFSFRGKKNKKLGDGVVHYPSEANNNSGSNRKADKQQKSLEVDSVFIPLKDPNDNVKNFAPRQVNEGQLAGQQQLKVQAQPRQSSVDRQPRAMQRESPPKSGNQVMGKPPLPKLPPRIVGSTTKQQQQQRAATLAPRASSTPREYDNEGEFYPQSMIGDGLKQYYSGGSRTMGTMGSEHKIGLIETNLDTDETIINGKTQSLMELGIGQNSGKMLMGRMSGMGGVQVMQSANCSGNSASAESGRPHKSMEFLLDKENHQRVLPPENELQKARESNVALSEHQLRVQASLQKLNIPDWYKQYSSSGHNTSANTSYYNKSDVTGLLRKRNSDIGRWQGLNSKTTSLSSLGSNRSDRSPVMLSPSAHSHTGGQTSGFSRWSTSHLNSSQTSPSVSARSSFVRNTNYNSSTMSGQSVTSTSTTAGSEIRNSFRKPYLGWRSQEKLSQPRTPHERLASSMMSQKQTDAQQKLQHPIATPEIQSSIKEVTSAIVHYVNDQTNRGSRSRSVSPSTRCWLESSFVGTKPLDSPQTPALENSFVQSHKINIGPMSVAATNYDAIRINGISGADAQSTSTAFVSSYYPSVRSSATSLEEEVILSLLGLPSDMHKSSSEDLANQSNYRGLSTFSTFKPAPPSPAIAQQSKPAPSQLAVEQSSHSRRHSEGDAKRLLEHHSQDYEDEKSDEIRPLTVRNASSTSTSPAPQYRRVSLDSNEPKQGDLLRCRYPRCENAATPAEAKKSYKSCHNCSHLYCSRDCRRNHWERGHRRACLHSRVSVLCRQVLSACKDDSDTLKHLSLLSRRGFLAQGRGVVRLLFRSPENADMFIKQGFQFLGEVSYVRWPDLLPSEMGPELYSELLRMSTEYKPDGKMLIYVAICVVSEAPASSTAPVNWERQLVSRCAKFKLCRTVASDRSLFSSSNPSSKFVKHEFNTDVLILTFNVADRFTQKSREVVLTNITNTLQTKGINLRKHFPEVHQRLSNYVEGLASFLPVTIHPRDNNTGRPFVCIIFPQNDSEKIKPPPKQETGDHVQTIDVGIERADEIMLTRSSLNDDLFTEGTKF